MIEHSKVKVNKENIKSLFVDYLQHQLAQCDCCYDKMAGAILYADLIVDFTSQLLDKVHPMTVLERSVGKGFKDE